MPAIATDTTPATRPVPVRPVEAPMGARWGEPIRRALPWFTVAVGWVATLSLAGTDVLDTLRFAAYWGVALLLPGTLVYRALRGSRGNLAEDLGYGAVVGLMCEGLAWAVAATTDALAVLWAWPVPVVVAFVAVPALRRHWRIREPRPAPIGWSWVIASICGLMAVWCVGEFRLAPLPPAHTTYYPDLPFHLSLVRELMRPAPFDIPQLAGEGLSYHFLSHAHLATGSLLSGVDPSTVLLRLWLPPILLVGALASAAFVRELTGRWWAGALAAAVTYVGMPLYFGGPHLFPSAATVTLLSPSMTFLVPPLLLLAALCCDVVRGRRLGIAWVLLPSLALMCAGAKGSGLPVLIAGMAVGAVAAGLRVRRIPWPAVAAFAALVAAMGLGMLLFTAGTGDSGIQFQILSSLQWTEPYRETLGHGQRSTLPGPLPPGLATAGVRGWAFGLGVLGLSLFYLLPGLAGAVSVARRGLRVDPAAWLLAGAMSAGVVAMWAVFHPGAGQHYFLRSALPFGLALTVWLLAEASPSRVRGSVVPYAVAAGLLVTAVLVAGRIEAAPASTLAGWAAALGTPVLDAAAIAAVVAVGYRILSRHRETIHSGMSIVVAGLLGACLGAGVAGEVWPIVRQEIDGTPAKPPFPERTAITVAEMRAARWLDAHAGADDVVATNVHCTPVATRPRCESRAFWVGALTGRRTVIEGWAFVPASVAAHGRDGYGYSQQPPPDPARFALNERAFYRPTAADLARLRQEYAVRWLFADRRAGAVSPELRSLAVVRHTDGPVTIYELTGS